MDKLFCDFTKAEKAIKPVFSVSELPCFSENEAFTGLFDKTSAVKMITLGADELFPNPDADEGAEVGYDFACLDAESRDAAKQKYTVYVKLKICDDYAKKLADGDYGEKLGKIILFTLHHLEGRGIIPKYLEIALSPESSSLSDEVLYSLYGTAAYAVKSEYTDIAMGGMGFSSPVSDKVHAFLNNLTCDSGFIPLDFLSWECTAYKAEQLMNASYAARVILDKYGFTDTLSVCTGWDFVKYPDDKVKNSLLRKSITGASFYSACLVGLQKTPTDLAFISSDVENAESGIFGNVSDGRFTPKSTYYSLFAFSLLAKCGTEVLSDTDADHLYVCGAKNDDGGIIVVTSYNPYDNEDRTVKLYINGIADSECEIYRAEKDSGMEKIYTGTLPEGYTFPPESITVIKVR